MLEHLLRVRGVFSDNEDSGDVVEECLPYLLCDYMLAICAEAEMQSRLDQLRMAYGLYFRFLQKTIRYGVDDVAERDALRRHVLMDTEDSEEKLKLWLTQIPRDIKIGRAKDMTRLKSDFESLALDDAVPALSHTDYWRICMRFSIIDSLNRLGMMVREMELLEAGGEVPGAALEPAKLRENMARISRPFQLVLNREQARNNVFKPGHSLPTMTIDEYLELEAKRGNIITGGGPASASSPSLQAGLLEDDEHWQDAETLRQREWDEFKDCKRASFSVYFIF